jgi:hypothetical protein
MTKACKLNWYKVTCLFVVLDGLVVIVLAIGLKVRGFNPGRGTRNDGFLRAIKISSTTSSAGEVESSCTCRKILLNVKGLLRRWQN